MRRVMSLMIGDLNASHLGLSGPGGGGPWWDNWACGLMGAPTKREVSCG